VWLGRPLMGLSFTQSDREASFRADLVHVRANAESVALLRREGLYSSHINKWREDRTKLDVKALEPRKRGPKPKPLPDPEVALLRRRVARLEHQLQRAQKVIEVQKKISELLGVEQPPLPDELKDEES